MAGSRILLIEDDPNVATLLTHHLVKAGFAISRAETVRGARELTRQADWEIAIVDRGLPDGDGVALLRDIRNDHPHSYLMMLTGHSSEEAKLEGFQGGADDYVTKPFAIPELIARVRAGARIAGLQKALVESNRRLEELTLTDPLTSLRNRRAFERELVNTYAHAQRYARPLSLAIVDVDHFKSVNDEQGHPAGDGVLRVVARILADGTRRSDFVARIGGEEFAILLPETPLFEAMQFGEKIRAGVAASDAGVTVSVGIANVPHSHVTDAQELFVASDEALYRAKENGRNRVELERRRNRKRDDAPRGGQRGASATA